MFMIPVPYALAAIMLIFLIREINLGGEANRSRFFATFLVVQIFQLVLIGTRFGYGMDKLLLIQPFTASLIPPLAYLSFKNPFCKTWSDYRKLWVHVLPLILTIFTTSFAVSLMDIALGLVTLIYAGALVLMGLRGQATLPWVAIGRGDYVLRLLWLTAGFLLISGLTDLLVALDFWFNQGHNTGRIAGIATTASLVAFGLLGMLYFFVKTRNKQHPQTNLAQPTESSDQTDTTMALVENYLYESRLYLDPDLNLNRLARKVGIPARQVSAAINRQTGKSVSQYINKLRIDEACRLLTETPEPVTRIMLAAGFSTKSNFNKEFKRQTGMSPSQWRKLDHS